MNYDEYYCDFTIDKNYILAYKVCSKKIFKLYFYNWKQIIQNN
jgi:hypothetical protein